jgi:hypothetical protein
VYAVPGSGPLIGGWLFGELGINVGEMIGAIIAAIVGAIILAAMRQLRALDLNPRLEGRWPPDADQQLFRRFEGPQT